MRRQEVMTMWPLGPGQTQLCPVLSCTWTNHNTTSHHNVRLSSVFHIMASGEEVKAETNAVEDQKAELCRCVVLTGIGGLNKVEVRQNPKPKPTEGHVLVKVHAWWVQNITKIVFYMNASSLTSERENTCESYEIRELLRCDWLDAHCKCNAHLFVTTVLRWVLCKWLTNEEVIQCHFCLELSLKDVMKMF